MATRKQIAAARRNLRKARTGGGRRRARANPRNRAPGTRGMSTREYGRATTASARRATARRRTSTPGPSPADASASENPPPCPTSSATTPTPHTPRNSHPKTNRPKINRRKTTRTTKTTAPTGESRVEADSFSPRITQINQYHGYGSAFLRCRTWEIANVHYLPRPTVQKGRAIFTS